MGRRASFAGHQGRANEPAVLILTSLAARPKHGYALAKDIESFAHVKLGPGTLYGAITRLEERGLIEPCGGDERRRPYQLTAAGRAELERTVQEMSVVAGEGARRLGLPVPGTWVAGLPPARWAVLPPAGWAR